MSGYRRIGSYKVFFGFNENNEPIYVHVTKEQPKANATKICLTKNGGCSAVFSDMCGVEGAF